jgi:anti-sigma regulatory factor (Ser/Thr protein kinase)
MITAMNPARDPFVHPALLYRGQAEYLAGTLPFIRAAVAAGEPCLVAVPGANLQLIRDGLGGDAHQVQLHDMSMAGRNPGRILPGVLLTFAVANEGKPVRIIGEPIWPGRSSMEYPACVQHEALINAAFTGRDATILCPYDVSGLGPEVIADTCRTHPILTTPDDLWTSPEYDDPYVVADGFNLPLPDPPEQATTVTVEFSALAAVRQFVADQATAAGISPERIADLTIAVNELTTNTIVHAEGSGTLTAWSEEGNLVCQISDSGHIADPLTGRIPPAIDSSPGGRGLFLVNHLCDLVRIHTRPDGTTIRIHIAS